MAEKIPYEEKIVKQGMKLKTLVVTADLMTVLRTGTDPDLTSEYIKFVELLVEAGNKKMYAARENALKKILL